MNAIILAIFGAFCLSFISALAIIKYATNTGKMLDKDEVKKPQKMHFGDIPRAGGVGIFVGFCAFVVILSTLGEIKDEYIFVLIPSCFIFLSGFWEDLNNSMSPKMRLFMQSIGALCAILLFQNCVITDIGFTLPYGFGVVFTLFCIVGVTNAINIIDGFNGLASGCAILMLASIAIVAYLVGNGDIFYIALIAIGAIVGFFVLNFPRGKIFLGDGGAYLVGFLLAFLLVTLTQNPQNLGENAESRLDSANQNNPSLRADSQNLRGNPKDLRALRSNHPPYKKTQNLQSRLPRSHSLARNDESLDSSLRSRSAQNDNLMESAESRLDSANQNNLSLRADSQNLRGNPKDLRALRSNHPPYKKSQNLQSRLPRSHSLARNDESLDSSLRKCSAQNDNLMESAEFRLDSAIATQSKFNNVDCHANPTDLLAMTEILQQHCETNLSDKSLKNAIFNSKVSAYYGLCIAIYPVFEVLFSIWRRRARKLQAMQPDCIHLHTLIFRRITRSNAKTSALIWALNSPFIFLPIFFYDNTAILLALIAIFVLSYIVFYKKITRFKRLFKADNPKI